MSQTLNLSHFLAQADAVALGVLALLLLASVGSWTLIMGKGWRMLQMQRRSQRFLAGFWEASTLEAVADGIRQQGATEPYAHLLHHGFTAVDQLNRPPGSAPRLVDAGAPDDMLQRALRRAIEEDKARLEFGQTFLATVASSGPFVGLFGTVWGIYHALAAIGRSGQSSLDQVAGPVGEALVMTGLGLAVAIPAAVAYNVFARASRNTLAGLNSFAHDVFNLLAHGVKASPNRLDARASSDKVLALVRAQGQGLGQVPG
jgi:biopolymer transport protein ExbB